MINFDSDIKEKKEKDDGEEKEEEEEEQDIQLLLDQANFQVTVLEAQLKAAVGEIKYLRTELSTSQLELLSSRSEVSVLLQELSVIRKQTMEQEEEFPDLLLNSLDKLCSDKQQQLFLISGIHNSIDKAKRDGVLEERVEQVDELAEEVENEEEEEGKEVPKLEEARVIKRSNPPLLKLELKKAYEFSPTPGLWSSRPNMTPQCCYAPKLQTWHTPTTPTPSSALRPSLSLHNLASVTFTEVLVPCLQPPPSHQVSPPSSTSPRTPHTRTPLSSPPQPCSVSQSPTLTSPISSTTSKSAPIPSKSTSAPSKSPVSTKTSPHSTASSPQSSKTSPISSKTSPLSSKISLLSNKTPSPSQTRHRVRRTPSSPPSPPVYYPGKRRVHKSLTSLEEIQENKFYLHCKKEISV